MQPIVNGLETEFNSCIRLQRVNYHTETRWHALIGPIGSPEFALLDSSENILHRWIGLTDKEDFESVLAPLCGA
jgi:hypothetical protein